MMPFPSFYRVRPRGNLSTGIRALQDRDRRQALGRVPGMRIRHTPGGTFAIPLTRPVAQETASAAPQGPPRWV